MFKEILPGPFEGGGSKLSGCLIPIAFGHNSASRGSDPLGGGGMPPRGKNHVLIEHLVGGLFNKSPAVAQNIAL